MRNRTTSIGSLDRIMMVRIVSTSATFQLRSMTMSGKSIGQKFEKNLNSRTVRKPKWVPNRQSLIEYLAVLQVFRIKCRAFRFEGCRRDQRVVDTEPVLLRNLQCRLMRIQRDWKRRREQDSNRIQRVDHVLPRHAHLTSCDRDEFV